METKKLFTENEIDAYKKTNADLNKRQKEGDLKDKWELYWELSKKLTSAMNNVRIMREKPRFTQLLDAYTIAVGSKMQSKINHPHIYEMRDSDEYCELFQQYNSAEARRALYIALRALVDDADEKSERKNKGIPHNVSFTGFSKILLGTGKEFTKNAKAYGAGLFNTDYVWNNDDGTTYRWKTDEVKRLCEMLLVSQESQAYVTVHYLTDELYDIINNEPDYIGHITKISSDIEVTEYEANTKKDDAYDGLFAATKNVRDREQIQKMLDELERRGLGAEPVLNPHVRQTKARIPKEFKEGDVILKSYITDLKTLLPVLVDMKFIKRPNGPSDDNNTNSNAKIVVFGLESGQCRYGFYHEETDSVKVPSWNYLDQELLVNSTFIRTIPKNIKKADCRIDFSMRPIKK